MCSRDEANTAGSASALSLANVGGVFVVLGAGLATACIVAIVEFVWKSRKVDSEERVSMLLQFGKLPLIDMYNE